MDEEEQAHLNRLAAMLRGRPSGIVFIESFFLIVIDLTALIGNVLVCYIFYKKPALRTITNVYVGALAISDVLMAVLAMPLTVAVLIDGQWVFGDAVCQFQGFVTLLLAWASLHIMTLTAINRYCRVVRATAYRKWFSVKSSCIMITVILGIIIIFIATPLLAGWSHFTFRGGKGMCFMTFKPNSKTTRKVYTAIGVSVYTVVPMVTIFSCYIKIFRVVNAHVPLFNPGLPNVGGSPTNMSVREVRVTKTLFSIFIGFLVCWIPVTVVSMLNAFTEMASLPRGAYLCYMYFAFISSAINPFIYAVMNSSFRNALLSILPCRHFQNMNRRPTSTRIQAQPTIRRSQSQPTNARHYAPSTNAAFDEQS